MLQFIAVTGSAQNSRKKEANDRAQAKAAEKADQKARSRKGFVLSNFLAIAFGSIGCILIGLAINYHTKGGYSAAKLSLLWGIIGYALFGAGLYFAYYEYVVKPARAAELASQSQRAEAEDRREQPSQRPELFVERTQLDPLTPGVPVTFRLDIKNRGRATARSVKVLTMHALIKVDEFKGALPYKYHPPERLAAIGPDASTTLMSAATWKVTNEQIIDIKARRTLLFHYGKGSYQGDGNKELVFDFCAMFEPSVGAVVVCPEQHWPKEETNLIPPSANRAFVIVQSADLTVFEVGKKTEALITFANAGRVPATNVRVYGHIQLRDKPLAPDMPGAKDIGEEPSQDIMPANGGTTLMPISSGVLTKSTFGELSLMRTRLANTGQNFA